jgi:predicted phage-related endonuclease
LGKDQDALARLWREKRGEIEPEDLSRNLLVQFGCATEELNRLWFEQETGRQLGHVQRFVRHPKLEWMGATLDGLVESERAVFESKFMLPWSFAEDAATDKHMAQLQHNMLVTGAQRAYLSILTGAARWALVEVAADPVYQTVLLQVERFFWRCVMTGEPPRLFAAEHPKVKVEAIRVVDMTASNAWAEHAAIFSRTRAAYLEHEAARKELKALVPDDARAAFGHGITARRSKSGALTLDVLPTGTESYAAVE